MMYDPFQVLGVTSSATEDEIKAAYRKLAKKYHPDLHPGSATAEAKMKEINEAYSEAMKIKKNGGRPFSSSQQSSSGYGAGGSWYNPFGAYGSSWQTDYSSSQRTYTDPVLQTAADLLKTGRFSEALQTLSRASVQNAAWHALSARANLGLNNRIAALQHARTAVQMEPNNFEYQQLLHQLQSAGQMYRQSGTQFGYPSAICANPFVSCVGINLLFNCLCGRGFFCC